MSMFKTALAGVVLSAGVIISLGASAHPKLLSSTPDSGAQGAAPRTRGPACPVAGKFGGF